MDIQSSNTPEPILTIRDLLKTFPYKSGLPGLGTRVLTAVDNVTVQVQRGEIMGLIGESGSGKSTIARCIVRLYKPDGGLIAWKNKDITRVKGKYLKLIRKDIQMVFQDPYSSLNPRLTVGGVIAEVALTHRIVHKSRLLGYVNGLLDRMGLEEDAYYRYPNEFSGGQRQRIGLARALATEPELLICDEPVSALDVSVQGGILNLLKKLRSELGLTILFISHDLRVVRMICDRVTVLYGGQIMEQGDSYHIFEKPAHPYTRSLIAAVPDPYQPGKLPLELKGEIGSSISDSRGCPFTPRCPEAFNVCAKKRPKAVCLEKKHLVYCHKVDKRKQ